ncbi:2-hydroxyacid dehydrogenase [Mycolicibacter sinensis]|uniref:Hydroxyacid dehydrogenase n=1 Tax=Mycolicibacter sinensis (strain JDM601) TaxID=875328 RepID=A0A1A2NSA8_MYCSD|nr:2-hydroxyacid dehydrogenase [Mycolicibacter sinensis]OBH17968.1 hydroxyacid dehydrogenase [Mycolicibacter sinensis]OBI29533.1 hydroxyacid dehydrogenase [Mycolicibacter sinensis]
MEVLEVGTPDPALAAALAAAKYQPLRLPAGAERDAFLAEHGPSVTAAVVAGPPGVDGHLMKALPNLGAIVNYGAGYDLVDVEEAQRRGIGVSNTPDVLNDSVADTAVGLVLATMRGLCAADRYVRAGRWPVEGPLALTRDVSGAQVGILGLGRIGAAIASRLLGFDCAISYHNRRQVPDCPYRYAGSPVELAESVDVLVVAVSGGNATRGLVSRQVLEALGEAGYLINVARGSVVDQDALVELLVSGRLAGAGLDVYTDEPHVPSALREQGNVVLLPHVGSATARTRAAMAALALRNLDEYLTRGTLTTPVLRPR